IKGGALVDGTFGSYCPAVTVNDALNGCQTYPGALKFISTMQPLKYAEQLVDILHIKSDAVVPYKDVCAVCTHVRRADLDFGGAARAREFDRIGEQVHDDLL